MWVSEEDDDDEEDEDGEESDTHVHKDVVECTFSLCTFSGVHCACLGVHSCSTPTSLNSQFETVRAVSDGCPHARRDKS